MSGCMASAEVEINGEVQDALCSQPEGHPEAHSAKIWWSDDDDAGEVQPNV